MSTKHWFQDRDGQIHKRTSANRVYSHAVVVKFKASGPDKYGRSWPARKPNAQYASTEALARKVAGNYVVGDRVEWVDVYPVSTGPLALAKLFPIGGAR